MKIKSLIFVFLFILTGISHCSEPLNQNSLTEIDKSSFIHRKGTELVIGKNDEPIWLKGVCFGNYVWDGAGIPSFHHSVSDYQRVKDMNMNAIRFYLNYSFFFKDNNKKQYSNECWAWLDDNIEMAKQHGIYLILNMHVPPGGFQSNGEGLELWDKKENQDRFKKLWKAIAKKYKNEPVIAGYDILNEPVTSQSIDQWKELAQETVDAIRSEDINHLIIVERLNGIAGKWETYSSINLFLVNDENTMYTFHYYNPIEYTHQNTSWTSFGEGGAYPDRNWLEVPQDATWVARNFNSPYLPVGNSDWTFYKGKQLKITDPTIIAGKPLLVSCKNSGNAYFDDFVVKEFDEKGNFVKNACEINIKPENDWQLWSDDQSGCSVVDKATGHKDSASLMVSDTTGAANCYNNKFRFAVRTNYSYSIEGWMKGERINSDAQCQLGIVFEQSPARRQAMPRDKEYLESELKRFIDFGKTNNVPVYVGEWGLYQDCFSSGKGGESWVSDMLDLFNRYKVHYTYHAYHESAFGIFNNPEGLPDISQANTTLIDLFKKKIPVSD
ncbi:MAG: hypothetical protein A2X42_09050 [Candidatus Margulisbacteria bacterium GWF2_38_17]|nr:MAG: hypothetical protein A2X43_03300 [Candidatus Margulisbacteria bacterium GWD2_39_127]OGI04037.1 MAG: hypothetical protein A2X42_09050 [Candidatus Margulisbacteria bacterium GWF2_38_17]OGI11990.1 MAG: hypothetical protein A2X41_02945 [Candidatus Margulisbacteria bacterium GWE2_39_32]